MDRDKMLDRVRNKSEPWDIVVIGGGATGVGCALDAAARGLEVLLVEQHDFGKGTSSRSTKLVHGGVRYLEQGNISLVSEALRERGFLLRNAPHVVRSREFVVPCYSFWQKYYYGVGLKIYDLLAGKLSLGKSRILSAAETRETLPTISTSRLTGGVLYYDGQFDDSRLLIDIAVAANDKGATILNYVRASAIDHYTASSTSKLDLEDVLSGERLSVKTKAIINAAGIFSDDIRQMSEKSSPDILTFSQGIHVVVGREFLPGNVALLIPRTSDGRVLFCIPWHGKTLIGTTETPIDKPILEPRALGSEIEFVLETAAPYLAMRPARRDILSVFAGIRPLVKGGSGRNTASLSRGHYLLVDKGMVTITGGKWTTYRRMAEDAVDAAIKGSGQEAGPCITRTLPITGPSNAGSGDAELLHPPLPYNIEDVLRAIRFEMAQTVEDVLARRTRALFLDAAAAMEMAPKVADIMAREKGKNGEWVREQIKEFNLLARQYSVD